ncbi:MAG TPA: lamin tail domain-containing protein [Lacipirellulaceae bacterium]|nr:lamin tail domain-containing protein [Lacipirellulaceae bacterium]
MIRHFCCSLLIFTSILQLESFAGVVINEFVYDDGGPDDREFVELYNNGVTPVDIGGWSLGGQDQVGPNSTVTITAGATINAGGFYVIGRNGVPNVNQIVTAVGSTGFWENDSETLELRNAGVLQDAVLYESTKGPSAQNNGGYGTLPTDVAAQVGPGIWGNNQSVDLPGTPLLSSASLARFVDGRDTNNNGRDFGFRPNTPGASNNPVNITQYTLPDISSTPVGTALPNFAYGFVAPHVVDPTVADAYNPNPIPHAPSSANRAIVVGDSTSDGGNAVSSSQTFATSQSKFDVYTYFDTRPLPQTATNVINNQLPGSEMTIYGIGGTDAFANLTDIGGHVGVPDTSNGTTGIAWVYEKVAPPNPNNPIGPGNLASEMLYLVDAKDGGDAGQGGARPFAWTVLASVDLSNFSSNWFRLGIDIDPLGNGVAQFGNQFFNLATAQQSGAFSVAYFNNVQSGSVADRPAILRPATFTAVPEPTTIALGILVVGTLSICRQRRKSELCI